MRFDNAIEGWFSDEDAAAYDQLAASLPSSSSVAEVGVHHGRSLSAIIATCRARHITIYAIDSWLDEAAFAAFDKRWLSHWGDVVVPMRFDSLVGAALLDDIPLSLVFLDADHAYDSVRADIAAWAPLVQAGGILAGHDYHDTWPGVVQAVSEAYPAHVKPVEGSSIWHARL